MSARFHHVFMFIQAIRILKQSLATFKLLCQDSPNKACMAEYVTAKLQAK